jgi:O-acetyl-ADP-ribose deacetylase (regulator of RNase III)
MGKIKYVDGDATRPRGEGKKIIVHCCNDIGAFGAGFVLALSRRWKEPEEFYRSVPVNELKLGNVQIVEVEKDIIVANMIGQHGVGYSPDGQPPIRYNAIRTCLTAVNKLAVEIGATVHGPKFGSGLAGGDWKEIEKIIKETVTVDVTVYIYKP